MVTVMLSGACGTRLSRRNEMDYIELPKEALVGNGSAKYVCSQAWSYRAITRILAQLSRYHDPLTKESTY